MDLARQIFVDLCTATHVAAEITAEPAALPAWAGVFAEGVCRIVGDIERGMQTADLAIRMALLELLLEPTSREALS
jgi:hypothetical protein